MLRQAGEDIQGQGGSGKPKRTAQHAILTSPQMHTRAMSGAPSTSPLHPTHTLTWLLGMGRWSYQPTMAAATSKGNLRPGAGQPEGKTEEEALSSTAVSHSLPWRLRVTQSSAPVAVHRDMLKELQSIANHSQPRAQTAPSMAHIATGIGQTPSTSTGTTQVLGTVLTHTESQAVQAGHGDTLAIHSRPAMGALSRCGPRSLCSAELRAEKWRCHMRTEGAPGLYSSREMKAQCSQDFLVTPAFLPCDTDTHVRNQPCDDRC